MSIYFFTPNIINYNVKGASLNPIFTSLSITGRKCSLMCEHCKGRLLESMISATSQERLIEVCSKIARDGYIGCLISGGSEKDGTVPIHRFSRAIRYVKEEFNLRIIAHIGLVREKRIAEEISTSEIDAALIDVIGHSDTIKQVCHLEAKPKDYEESILLLKDHGIRVVPHIVVGIHYGQLKGEFKALDIIANTKPDRAVIVIFTPFPGTGMESISPPSISDVAKVLVKAKKCLSNIPILLGCIRPRGQYGTEVEKIAIKLGLNGIALPSKKTLRYVKTLGLKSEYSGLCCAIGMSNG